ncbi:unnamed protein product, partial [Medioppia subpectinata]
FAAIGCHFTVNHVMAMRVFDDLELQYKTLFEDQILDDIITRSEGTLKSDRSVGNGIKGKHKRMVRLKTNEDNKSADDLTTGPQLGSNDIINETLVGVKRSQRLDFIEPKPIFGDKSADNKDLVDNEEVVDSGCEETDGTSGVRVRATISGYLCEYPNCDYMNVNKGNVSRHISKMHLNKRPLVCDDCGQTFWGQKRLFLHRKATHLASLVDSGNRRQYKCDWHDCTYQCKSLTNLNLHRRRHSGQKPFKCQFPDCVSSFVTNSELKTHTISIHSNESPFKCEWSGCGHAFKTKERLKCHSYNHNNEWPYVCEWPGCDAKYAKNSDLRMHRLCIHSNDKPYPCEWPACEARFKTKNGRRLHNYTHTGERPYRCEWPGCEASYYMVSKLNRHKLSHNGIKNYRCLWPDCDMKYSTIDINRPIDVSYNPRMR